MLAANDDRSAAASDCSGKRHSMKAIIGKGRGGTTYNTATAAVISTSKHLTLYQTPKGVLFVMHHADCERKGGRIEAVTRRQAETIVGGKAKLDELPRGADSTVLYLRIPLALKARIEAAAEESDMSANQWALRALEAQLARES
jgi:HicB-like protein involved in pilus formation